MSEETLTLYTIGHSNIPLNDFLALLHSHNIKVLVDVRSDYQLRIPEGDWSTLGGYVFSTLGRLPKLGDRVAYPGGELEVVAMDGRRVAAVRVHKPADRAAT